MFALGFSYWAGLGVIQTWKEKPWIVYRIVWISIFYSRSTALQTHSLAISCKRSFEITDRYY